MPFLETTGTWIHMHMCPDVSICRLRCPIRKTAVDLYVFYCKRQQIRPKAKNNYRQTDKSMQHPEADTRGKNK